MHYTFTLKKMGRLLRILPILTVAMFSFAGSSFAQCTWTAAPVYPVPVLDAPSAVVGTTLYTFAGVSNGGIVATSNKFNGTTWSAIAPLPAALEFPSAVSDGTNIYITGGANTVGASVTSNYRYNVATNTYTTLAPCAVATWSHAAVFLNNKIYKIGGIGAAPVGNVEIYDIATNTWTAGAAYPTAGGFIGATSLGGFIYAAGGINTAGTVKTYRYDPATNTWDDASIADLPATRWGAAASNYRNGFVMAGGYAGGDVTANISTSVISWDPASNTWSALPNLLTGAARFAGTILNDAFYVVGGRSQASSGFVGIPDVQKLQCPPLVACAGTPNPGNTFATATAVCVGTSVTFSAQNPTAGTGVTYQWQTSAAVGGPFVNAGGTSTNPTYTTTVSTATYYRVQVTCGSNSGFSTPIQVTTSACTCLNPDVATICEGAIQKLSINGAGTPGSASVPSGTVNVAVPDANPAGVTSTIAVALPAGASITSMTVTINNFTHTWDSDMQFNLVAPNGQILNLINSEGGSGDNFTGTVISSAGGAPFATGTPPFTGTFAADAATGVGPTGLQSNVTTWPPLYTVPNGNWRLAMVDNAGGDVGNLQNWTLNFNYVVLPTGVWTGGAGTIFTNAAATTPYIAGSQANTIYVNPITTTTYTATITGGPCAGANNVTVTVLPRPVVTVNPTTGCAPLTITASGAATYSWTPATGLNQTTGATVIANPGTTTVYTVTGRGSNGCFALPVSATVNGAPTASVLSSVAGAVFQIDEGFNGTGLPAGWSQLNRSNPIGAGVWGIGAAGNGVDPAFDGAVGSYLWVNYQSGSGTSTLSNWLFTPTVTVKNGDIVSFYTRAATGGGIFPDRLQLRLSTNGASTNVGANETTVGDFTTLLVDVNPTLSNTAYPETWTKFTATVSGVTGTVTGRLAFRYFVTNGGPGGANSNLIGIDRVQYQTPSTVTCANTVSNLTVNITGGVSPYTVVYSNGTTNTTFTNYTSGANIQVSPSVSTTYTLVSVTGANGCAGTGNTGSATITVTPPVVINTQPAAITNVCVAGNGTITVVSAPTAALGTTYQWQVSTDGGTTFTNITNGGVYGGATTASLTITGATAGMNNNRYRVLVNGACGGNLTSTVSVLSVNTAAVITAPIAASNFSACQGNNNTTLSVTATGNALTYQWQVSTDGGLTFSNIANNANYSGATTSILTLTNVPATFLNNQYRVLVTSGGCTAVISVVRTLTAINPAPVVVISASPGTTVAPGQNVTLTAAVSSATAPITYQWYRNNVAIPGANAATYVAGPDGAGFYSVTVADANGCGTTTSTPISITLTASASTVLFIYPSPNSGTFQVRYYNRNANATITEFASVNVFDSKGSRVFTGRYSINGPYTQMNVNLGAHGKGIYRVELTNDKGDRLNTGSVLVF